MNESIITSQCKNRKPRRKPRREKVSIKEKREKVSIVNEIPTIVPSDIDVDVEDSIDKEYENHLPRMTRQLFQQNVSIAVKIPRNIQEFKELLLKHKETHDSAKYLFNRCFLGTKSSRSEFMKYFDLLNYAEKNI